MSICYHIQKEFGLSIQQMREMPTSTFRILAEELKRDYDNQKKEMEKSRRK